MDENNIELIDKRDCFGCSSCSLVCPIDAIKMKENHEGFLYPKVDDNCLQCGKCLEHCPVLTKFHDNGFNKQYYGVINRDRAVLQKSSSGGVFYGIAEYIIDCSGVVIGCAFNDSLIPEHVIVDNKRELLKLQGSKYVESKLGDVFLKTQSYLSDGFLVLFTGTPCQIAGLYAFLGVEYENLYTIDIVCHGTPSRKLFTRYLSYLSKVKIEYYSFRDKSVAGWSCGNNIKAKIKDKINIIDASSDPYYSSFLRGETYRESCYECRFANLNRVGDITIGDFWGVEEYFPEIDYKSGVSLCILNNDKGSELLKKNKNKYFIFPCEKEQIVNHNTNLVKPTVRPEIRDKIYILLNNMNNNSFFKSINTDSFIIAKLRKIFRKYLPVRIKKAVKRMYKN